MRYSVYDYTRPNPAWDASGVAEEIRLRRDIPVAWRPHHVQLGCGEHGCVFETADPEVVMKVTDDETEAELVRLFGHALESVCVRYFRVMDSRPLNGRRIFVLWRERAHHVGKLLDVVETRGELLPPRPVGQAQRPPPRDRAENFIDRQLEAGQSAFWAASTRRPIWEIKRAVDEWVDACEKMAVQKTSPELSDLGSGLVEVFRQNRLLFGDIHIGNLGVVKRVDGERWVITDPGHVMVMPS